MKNEFSLNFIDKSSWIDGPWKNEPDKIVWKDEESGYDCLIRRNAGMGFLCGYVAVEKDHPCYGKPYHEFNFEYEIDDIIQEKINEINIHGGLTYSDYCQDSRKETGICHITENENDKAYWFGFDCGHSDDMAPFLLNYSFFDRKQHYRDVNYVKDQCKSLAKQLKALENFKE